MAVLGKMAYRSSNHESTGESPVKMMLGRDIKMPVDLLLGTSNEVSIQCSLCSVSEKESVEHS